MRIIFLGVDEAFDEALPNNSHLVLGRVNLLLDCGYSIPRQVWTCDPDQSFLDGVYISHGHADHFFGLPPLLVRMWEEKRKKPLSIICPRGLRARIDELMELGYQGIRAKLGFELLFTEVENGETIRWHDMDMAFASTVHPAANLAIRIGAGGKSVCYSGDGMFDENTEKLYRTADLVIHEAFSLEKSGPGHANIADLVTMAEKNDVACLALTHLQRDLRRGGMHRLKTAISRGRVRVIIPEPLEAFDLS